jgi:autoinducer 2-degrading protein
MLVVHVHCLVNIESIAAFREASLANARASVQEPGILRFDVLEQDGEPDRFVLVEVYRTPEDAARHKETAHYATWRDTVAEMMAKPRSSTKFTPAFPTVESAWLCDVAEE